MCLWIIQCNNWNVGKKNNRFLTFTNLNPLSSLPQSKSSYFMSFSTDAWLGFSSEPSKPCCSPWATTSPPGKTEWHPLVSRDAHFLSVIHVWLWRSSANTEKEPALTSGCLLSGWRLPCHRICWCDKDSKRWITSEKLWSEQRCLEVFGWCLFFGGFFWLDFVLDFNQAIRNWTNLGLFCLVGAKFSTFLHYPTLPTPQCA